MRNVSLVAVVCASIGFAIVSPTAAWSAGGMGDPSANMRRIQEICNEQRCGEYPPYPTACSAEAASLPLYCPDSPVGVTHGARRG